MTWTSRPIIQPALQLCKEWTYNPNSYRELHRKKEFALAPSSLSTAAPLANPLTKQGRQGKLGQPRLSVIIVNYRQWDQTENLVHYLQNSASVCHGDVEIVVVDNHSPRHPIMGRLRRQPNVSLRRWKNNQGFARAVNEGCRLSRGEWFLLLNPDTTPSEGFLDGVVAMIESLEPKVGIVGFHLRNSDGTRQLSSGPFPTLLSTLTRLALSRSRRKYQTVRAQKRCEASWVTGCCMLLRRECVDDLAGLDEDYFLYYEDVDLCLRAKQRGWSVNYEPNLAIVHHHPLHQRTVPAALRLVTRHSLMVYAAKHWQPWQFRFLTRVVQAEACLRRVLAWWSGDTTQGRVFASLAAMSRELRHGDFASARRRLDNTVRQIDVRVGV